MEELKKEEKNNISQCCENNQEREKEQNSRRSIRNKIFAGVALVVLVAAFFGAVFGFASSLLVSKYFNKKEVIQKSSGDNLGILENNESAVINVVEKANPSVVSIVVTKDVPKFRSFFDNPFGFGPFSSPFENNDNNDSTEKQEVGGGSGFIVSSDGTIVTNKHVVSDSEAEYTVITSDNQEYKATVIVKHPTMDIALLKIDGDNFSAIDLGDSTNLKVGQFAVAIGNPLGEFSNSVSLGIISGLKRDIVAGSGFGGDTEKLSGIIQTDAAINPGNSGGPLLDLSGRVIGVNVAVAQGAENIGFALPIEIVKKTLTQMDENGKIAVPFLGVRYALINEKIKSDNNLPFSYGALVVRGEQISDLAVSPGSPADKAGIIENDIILEIKGEKITEEKTLSDIISQYEVGEEIVLKIWHKGEDKEVTVRLEARQ